MPWVSAHVCPALCQHSLRLLSTTSHGSHRTHLLPPPRTHAGCRLRGSVKRNSASSMPRLPLPLRTFHRMLATTPRCKPGPPTHGEGYVHRNTQLLSFTSLSPSSMSIWTDLSHHGLQIVKVIERARLAPSQVLGVSRGRSLPLKHGIDFPTKHFQLSSFLSTFKSDQFPDTVSNVPAYLAVTDRVMDRCLTPWSYLYVFHTLLRPLSSRSPFVV